MSRSRSTRTSCPRAGARRRCSELLDLVGLNPEHINRYPHQFSGGQRQRIGIARGIALRPKVLICDEPVSALDVSVQAQVVNLMEKLQDELGLSYVFIAHDLSVVRHISDRVGVMYLGRMAELGTEDEIYQRPTHPYTQALLSAVPVPDPTMRGKRDQIVLTGDVPSPANPPSGCRFHTRCLKAQECAASTIPSSIDRPDGVGAHLSACHFAEPRVIVETVDVTDVEPDPRYRVHRRRRPGRVRRRGRRPAGRLGGHGRSLPRHGGVGRSVGPSQRHPHDDRQRPGREARPQRLTLRDTQRYAVR